jgi:hypothetical protein
MKAELPNHEPSLMLMNCGEAGHEPAERGLLGDLRPGHREPEPARLHRHVPGRLPIKEAENWQAGFLPGVYQGTFIDPKNQSIEKLIEHIRNRYLPARSSAGSSTCCSS